MNKLKYIGHSSGKLSYKSPNTQNIPKDAVRTEFKSKGDNLITIWDLSPDPTNSFRESRVITFKPKSDDKD